MLSSFAIAPDHRTTLWKALLTAEFNVCYWTLLSRRDTKIDIAVKGVIALAPVVIALQLWTRYPLALAAISMAAPIGVWLHTAVFTSDRLKKVAVLVGTWKQIAIEYDLLWQYDCDLSDDETWKRFEEATKLQGKTDETGLPIIEKLREKAFQQMMRTRGY
jgi:hypothetical protein